MQACIRRAKPEDLAYLLPHLPDLQDALCRYSHRREETPPAKYFMGGQEPVRSSLSQASLNSLCLIAETNGQIVGVLVCRGGRYREIRHIVNLEVFVSSEHRRQGIGSALVREALRWARETDIVRRVEVRVPSRRSHCAFYESFGFEKEGVLRETALDGDEFINVEVWALLL
jgi:GNAT superfamily N-acetyltransferase